MSPFITDLHCDLLDYLEGDSKRSAHDAAARCSITQLRAGNVKLQTLAIFVRSGSDSVSHGMAQAKIYKELPHIHPNDFIHFNWKEQQLPEHQISLILAIENASAFCNENEPLAQGLERLHVIIEKIAKPLYISMTWNDENRFGGGSSTQVGLKADGKHLLHFMHGKKIAIDLSHTSDQLALDILNYIDQEQLTIPVLASHSNARSVTSVARNLPDPIAREIVRRGGLIGINFYRKFVGNEVNESFIQHLLHWLKIGAKSHICFGADFFYSQQDDEQDPMFFPQYQEASCYAALLNNFAHYLSVKDLKNLAHQNTLNFLKRLNA
jgi:microsomal dipeptidase-like Zn-dependent dipeptidase